MSQHAWTGLDPSVERLLEESRERERQPLGADRLTTWLMAGGFLAVALPLAAVAETARAPSIATVVLLVLAYAVVSRIEFEVGSGVAVPTQLVLVPMLFLLPAAAVPLTVALGYLTGLAPELARGRIHPERGIVPIGSCWHALGPAAVLLIAGEPEPSLDDWPLYFGVLAAQFAFDFGSVAAREHGVFKVPLRELVGSMSWVFTVDSLLAPIGLLAALAAVQSPAGALAVLPLAGLLTIFARERRLRLDHSLELSAAYRGTAFLLGDVIEADDEYTGSHSRDVVELTLAVADAMGLDARERRKAELAALLHDVGKIRIPAEIINKNGPLDAEERALMETHTVEGERLLEQVGGLLGEIGVIVRSCHERVDGKGYPDGLAREEIPLVARIVCCCDAFNAMTTDRSYRKALPLEVAVAELEKNAGTQFDADVVAALVRTLTRPER